MGFNKKMMGPFNYKLGVKWIVALVIFVFLGKTVWDHWNQVKDASFTFEVFPLIVSTLIFAFSYSIQVWAWTIITVKLGIAIPIRETFESWFYSQLGKYLPGKVWLLLSRFHFYESRGMSRKKISIALYLEMVAMNLAAGLIFLATLVFPNEIGVFWFESQFAWPVIGFMLAAFVFLHPWILQKILNWVLVRLKKEPISLSISYWDVLWILLICIVAWLVGGVGFYIFVDSVYPVTPQFILFLTGALAISSTLGLVAIFAPSGLGVREGVLVYLLSFMMATPVAVIISILTRLWMTLVEMGLIGVIYLFDKLQRPQKRDGHDTI